MPLRSATVLLLVALVGGCVSAKGAYEDGMALEVAGDYAAAADAYALALERDRSLPNVPGRLAVAGREAVAQWVAAAPFQDAVGAANRYLAADALIRRAGALGVDLQRPPTFGSDLDATLDAAVVWLHAESRAALAADEYADALRLATQARSYRPTAAQQAALDTVARTAHAGWAEADYVAGRFRSAYGRAETALALYRPDEPGAAAVLDLLDDIVAAGTVVAAVFPAESGEALPRGLLRDFDDVLVDDELVPLPPFVALVDPVAVRRQAREDERDVRRPVGQENPLDLVAHPLRTARFARDLGADLGVAVEVGPLVETRTEGEARTVSARLRRGGTEATYQRRPVTLEASLRASVVVVDAVSGRVVCQDEVRREGRDRSDRASYAGNWRDLDLSRSERALFADDVAADRLLRDLRDETAAALAPVLVRCLERQVP